MSHDKTRACPDCDGVSRRDLLKAFGSAAVVAAAGSVPVFATARAAAAEDAKSAASESLVTQLYSTLTDDQKKAVCFGWEHPKRLMIANNWSIVPQKIGEFYTPEQQELIFQIFKGAHSEEWVPKRLKQLQDDAGGFKNYQIAMFGQPGTPKFEWVMTGRHLTLRVDGNSEPGVAFGGPVFYGHAVQGNEKPDHPGNVYWYQAQQANEVFKALDGKQREKALITGPIPAESPATLIPSANPPGLRVSEMTADQRGLVTKVLQDIVAPMRAEDVAEARRYLMANGGVNSLNMAFYKQEDIGDDGVWDVWRLEGPTMVWYFRGSPHVHVWVHVSEKPLTRAYPGPTG